MVNMKKCLLFVVLLFGLFATNSCKEEVDLIGEYKETAFVFGLLDQADSIHTIKIMRTFVGPGNAEDIAKIPDSNYFENVNATITEYVNNIETRSWILTDTILTNKDENGAFFAPEQKLYYFATSPSNPLNPDATYRLKIDIDNGKFSVEGETELVDGITTSMSSQNAQFKFVSDPAEYIPSSLSVNTGSSFIVNTKLNVSYSEIGSSFSNTKSFDWNLGEVETTPGSSLTFSANGQTFYNLMAASCANGSPSVQERNMGKIDVVITGGAEVLYNYMLVNQPSSSLAQSKPTYTNLSVTDGYGAIGIFSSRQTVTVTKPFFTSAAQAYIRSIDKKSTSELCIGPITGSYFFCSHHPGDNILNNEEPYSCN